METTINKVLLTSEDFVKSLTCISDNVAGKYLRPAIMEAQDFGLRHILGDRLTRRLQELVGSGEIAEEANARYKELLDRAQYYLAYSAVVGLIPRIAYKLANIGVATTTDENVQAVGFDEVMKMREYYQERADQYCKDVQRWLLDNYTAFGEELTEEKCHEIRANLYSGASCGVWLGGPRGKGRRGGCGRR